MAIRINFRFKGRSIPDPARAIDVTLAYLYPETSWPGFTSVLRLNEVHSSLNFTVRKLLSAGAALYLVRDDPSQENTYYVAPELHRLLARIRAETSSQPASSSPAVLTCGLPTARVATAAPSAGDISGAIDDLASGASEYVILAAADSPCANYIQSAPMPDAPHPLPLRVECRIRLNDDNFEHYHLIGDTHEGEYFAGSQLVKDLFLHWLSFQRLPDGVKLRNISEFFTADEPISKLPYWVQTADGRKSTYDSIDVVEAASVLREYDWAVALRAMKALSQEGRTFCQPGIGFVAHSGHTLHICPRANLVDALCTLLGPSADNDAPRPAEDHKFLCEAESVPASEQREILNSSMSSTIPPSLIF